MTPEESMGVNFNDSKLKPKYYANNGKDLFDRFEEGLMTAEQNRGFYIGNVFKYITRYQNKNGIEDLEKAETYLKRLISFEQNAKMTDSEKMFKNWKDAFKDWDQTS